MAAKKLEKRAKKTAKQVKKILDSKNAGSKARTAGIAAAGIAGIAGIAAALAYLRRDAKGRAKLHVKPGDGEWLITADGQEDPLHTFGTKKEAVEVGREAAQKAAPSQLVIHRRDGSVIRSHLYEPA